MVALVAATVAMPQWTFRLDTTFRTAITRQAVNDILVLPTGELLLSGTIRFPGDMSNRLLAKVDASGDQVVGYPYGPGGGKITPWTDRFYISVGQIVQRVLPSTGWYDPTYIGLVDGPYISVPTAGDYHVFPDGRVLLTGSYLLSDSIRGFEGQYRLVWISNEGYLDTTRTHRQANGMLWNFTALPDGKFLCSCTCTQYDGQPVDRLFRIHADGSLDPTFVSGVNWGNIYAYYALPDGRVYVGGQYKRAAAPNDTLYLARFMPDGSLDASFDNGNIFRTLPGMTAAPKVLRITPWLSDRSFITGVFQTVNGMPRGGICVLDDMGGLTSDMEQCNPGPFSYQGSTDAAIIEIIPTPDTTGFYICGVYNGYTDGTLNDPGQRFVSRLLVSEISTGATEQEPSGFSVYPNPATGTVTFTWQQAQKGHITIRDLAGRTMATWPMNGIQGQQRWDVRGVAPGTYVVQVLAEGQVLHTERLVVQQ
ncbi:MAG: T9SS type A sorting domain-containing protein [Flavobacteriales bacterium]